MHVFQTAAYVARRSMATMSGVARNPRVLSVRLTNGTSETIECTNGPLMGAGTCAISFTSLRPGEAGTIRFSSEGSAMDGAMTGCHHTGAIELGLGDERFFIAVSCPIGQSVNKNNRFVFEFADAGDSRDLEHFYRALPPEFMGMPGARDSAQGKEMLARATASSRYEVDLVLLGTELSELESLDTLQHLEFAQMCKERRPDLLIQSLFVSEVMAVFSALSPVRLVDKVFVLDLMIFTFVMSGLLELTDDALQMNLGLWMRNWCLQQPATQEMPDYAAYLALAESTEALLAHAEAAQLLLRAASFRAMTALHDVMVELKGIGILERERPFDAKMAAFQSRRGSILGAPSNDDIMREHLSQRWRDASRSGSRDSSDSSSSSFSRSTSTASSPRSSAEASRAEAEASPSWCFPAPSWSCAAQPRRRRPHSGGEGAAPPALPSTPASARRGRRRSLRRGPGKPVPLRHSKGKREGVLASLVGCANCGAWDPDQEDLTRRPEDLLKMLVRHCIHTSSEYAISRKGLFEAVEARLGAADHQRRCLRRYMASLPLAQRSFSTDTGYGLPGVRFRSYSGELFGNLDDGSLTGPEQVLNSLGYSSVEYKEIATNSKSGEFFFISDDKCFLIKTISENECLLLQRMLTEYQDHIGRCPRSVIVRYAGLFHVEVPEARLSQYFTVMRSVFNRQYEIHETYDLKGSLFKRKRKAGESIGKDEDWLKCGKRIDVPADVQRELCATHELDTDFLRRFGVMDYSILVGLHAVEDGLVAMESETGGIDWKFGGGMLSKDHRTIYFIGLIDFLIGYDLRKEGEHLIRVAQGHGEDASCVSPQDYAARQVKFVRDALMPEGDEVMGSLGVLRVDVRCARDLVAADWLGTSDPYVQVSLGLLNRRTHTIPRDCNPRWQCELLLPVNQQHARGEVELSVWDEDQNRALRGADDYLGKVVIRMERVISSPQELRGHALAEVKRGRIWARLRFEPVPDA